MSDDAPHGYRRISGDRFREVVGLGYDDFAVGRIIEHRPGRTVTEFDNVLMATLTSNAAPIHLDAHYSSTTEWGRILVDGIVTLGIVAGMTVRSTSGLTVGNLGLDEARFEHPVFAGDTLYAETEILARRLSKSRPNNGIITCRTVAFNQKRRRVLQFKRTFLVPTDPDTVRDSTNY